MSGSEQDWTPVHHFEADDEPAPTNGKQAKKASEPAGRSIPVGMSLMLNVPQDIVDAISTLAESQRQVMEQINGILASIDSLTDRLDEKLNGKTDELQKTVETTIKTIADANAQMIGTIGRTVATQMETHGKAMAALMTNQGEITSAIDELQRAILAPRSVRIERDSKGNAIGAVSETSQKMSIN